MGGGDADIRDVYRTRNLVGRLRLKDWRRIATRYDKLAANSMAGVFLAAAITPWCVESRA
jgi:transposase